MADSDDSLEEDDASDYEAPEPEEIGDGEILSPISAGSSSGRKVDKEQDTEEIQFNGTSQDTEHEEDDLNKSYEFGIASQLTDPYSRRASDVRRDLQPQVELEHYIMDAYVQKLLESNPSVNKPAYVLVDEAKILFYPETEQETKIASIKGQSCLEKYKGEIWTRNLIIPLLMHCHYTLLHLDFEKKTINLYDSLQGSGDLNQVKFDLVCKVFELEANNWELKIQVCPKQNNSTDCGYYVLHFIKFILKISKSTEFSEDGIATMRQDIFKEFFPSETWNFSNKSNLTTMELDTNNDADEDSEEDPDNDSNQEADDNSDEDVEDDDYGESNDDADDDADNYADDGNDKDPAIDKKDDFRKSKRKRRESKTGSNINDTTKKRKRSKKQGNTLPEMSIHRLRDDKVKQIKKKPGEGMLALLNSEKISYNFHGTFKVPQFGRMVYIFSRLEPKGYDFLLNRVGVKVARSHIVSSILLIPIKDTFYALTKGNAWENMMKLIDHDFVLKIPVQILDPGGANILTIKPVFGDFRSKKLERSRKVCLKNLEIGDVCESFTGTLDGDHFDILFPTRDETQCKVEVGVGRIKFKLNLSLQELTQAMDKLEELYHEPLNDTAKNSGIRQLMLKTTFEIRSGLENELIAALVLNSNDPGFLANFDVCPRKSKEYTSSNEITVSIGRENRTLPSNANLADIIEAVKLFESVNATNITGHSLAKIRISWGDKPEESKIQMLSMLRGSFYSKIHKRTFFKLNIFWYYISDEFIMRVQRQFIAVLISSLLSHSQSLQKPWPHEYKIGGEKGKQTVKLKPEITENKYSLQYDKNLRFLLGDRKTPDGIELFDLLHVNKAETRSNLYHIKHGFSSSSTSVACGQLLKSAEYIDSIEPKSGDLLELYKDRFKKNGRTTPSNFLTHIGFGDKKKDLPTFVLTLLTNEQLVEKVHSDLKTLPELKNLAKKSETRSLQLEKLLKLEFTRAELDEILWDCKNELALKIPCANDAVVDNVIEFLEENQFVEKRVRDIPADQKYLVKPKLLQNPATDKFVPLFSLDPGKSPGSGAHMLSLKLQNYTTFFRSLGSKIDIIRTEKAMRNMRFSENQFKICEILSSITNKDKEKSLREKCKQDNANFAKEPKQRFKCSACDKDYASKGGLNGHIKKMHPSKDM